MPYVYNLYKDGLDFVSGPGGFLPGGTTTPGGDVFTWIVATGATAVVSNGTGILAKSNTTIQLLLNYIEDNTQRVARIVGCGVGLWTLQLFSGQTVQFGNEQAISEIQATNSGDALELVALTRTDWRVTSSVGNLNIS